MTMKINKLTPWAKSLQNSVRGIIDASKCKSQQAKYLANSNMVFFFDNGMRNPSVAKIIANDEIQKQGFGARFHFFNKYNSKNIADQKTEFEDTFTKLYPQTGKLRTRLINAGRFSLDEIRPKASKLEKFFLGFKL